MAVLIGAIGTAVPGQPIANEQFVQHAKRFACGSARQERVLEELYRRTEIRSRASVLTAARFGQQGEQVFYDPASADDFGPSTAARMKHYERESAALAVDASLHALTFAGIGACEITHLVSVSCTGFCAPGFDMALLEQVPLPSHVARTHIGFMGCHGGMNALRVASAFAKSNPQAVVLVCMAELCSLHFQYGWHADNLIANSLFADGAAAFVVRSDSGWTGQCGQAFYRCLSQASYVVPGSLDAMSWRISDSGFRMHLNSAVPDLIRQHLPQMLDQWLNESGITRKDIKSWAVHPGGPRILDAVGQCLELSGDALDASRAVLCQYGNMSSPTVWFILDLLKRRQAESPTVVLGFGPGLAVEAALLSSV